MASSGFSATSLIDLGKGSLKKYTDKQIQQYLTTGATPMGSWNAETNTPTLIQGSGTLGQYYDVIQGGTWDGINFLVGDRLIFSAKSKWERVPTGVEQDDIPMVVSFIDEALQHLPTSRTSGKALLIGDSVKVKSTAILPFTVDGITFDSYADEAVWNGTAWQEQSYNAGKTNEVLVNNPTNESVSGSAQYQSDVNIENKTNYNTLLGTVNTLNEEYKKAGFTFNATTQTIDGIDITTLVVKDKDNNELLNIDLTGKMTAQGILDAIKDLPAELKNKTIDCGTFNS